MKIVSLFAGCGGLDRGFEQAGFEIIWANEYDETIHETYRLNHPKTILNTSDVRTLSGKDIPDCDGIIGGPPCQAWSEGGKRLGLEDPRGQLFLDYIRIVKEKQPKFFVIENVQGILEEKHKDALAYFLQMLKEAGYNVTYELLNAADYRVPQDRFRVFFIGIRKDLPNKYSFPDSACDRPITLRQAIGDITEEPRFYGDELVECVNESRANHDVYTGSYDEKYMARNRVRLWDEPSFTMQAQARNAPQHPRAPKMTFISSKKRIFAEGYESLYRRLSVRECARIQTFPDSFEFVYRDVKDGYKMVGNAVPPRLSWYLAVQMKKAFQDAITSNTQVDRNFLPSSTLSVTQLSRQFPKQIITRSNRCFNSESIEDAQKHVLICLVKRELELSYLDRTAKLYYTGRYFPAIINLGELYYFMPYFKGRGIRDLYIIRVARVGSKQEVVPNSSRNDQRIIFEIEYHSQLFENFKPFHLNLWNTFTDTRLERLIMSNEEE